ncbi:TMEM165/GDT1 family protein [Chitinilyticum litopenaei]|uniref:TMEM165/GDT1 family protein n=1 Tax=Chitinilyticum litopenaei TaxID=1121276 RepID=UPI000427E632|nr:TMEM165/GDT1 family protein [Chitinilyticum litopenaei]
MDALLVSTGVVAVAEIGDKTQLLALILAARFRRPWPIVLGIFCATVLNHALAGWLGQLVAGMLNPDLLRWIIGIGFLAIAAWALIPDEMDDDEAPIKPYGAFVATLVAFFIAEMGDKTQVATVALAIKYQPLWQVVLGTTIGMMIANVPAVWLGKWIASHLHHLRLVRFVAAAVFALLGLLAIFNVGQLT